MQMQRTRRRGYKPETKLPGATKWWPKGARTHMRTSKQDEPTLRRRASACEARQTNCTQTR
eukprot:3019599-Pleurochrysis_carterae.AAC.1